MKDRSIIVGWDVLRWAIVAACALAVKVAAVDDIPVLKAQAASHENRLATVEANTKSAAIQLSEVNAKLDRLIQWELENRRNK